MGRKSSQKSARRAQSKKDKARQRLVDADTRIYAEEHKLYGDPAGLPSLAELEAEVQQKGAHRALYGDGTSTASSRTGTTGGRQFRGKSNKYNLSELNQLVQAGSDEYSFQAFCNFIKSTEDVSDDLFDDPQFRALHKHMMNSAADGEALGLDHSGLINMAIATNKTGTDPDELIARYSKKNVAARK